jgi:hypothetical protein
MAASSRGDDDATTDRTPRSVTGLSPETAALPQAGDDAKPPISTLLSLPEPVSNEMPSRGRVTFDYFKQGNRPDCDILAR